MSKNGENRNECMRNALLQKNLLEAIPIILGTELKEHECLTGVVRWNLGLIINPGRKRITQEEMKAIRQSFGSNNCVFRYFPGKPLELLF